MSAGEFLKKLSLFFYVIFYKYCYHVGLFALGVVGGAGQFAYRHVRHTERRVGSSLLRARQRLTKWRRRLRGRCQGWKRGMLTAGRTLRVGLRQAPRRPADGLRLIAKALASLWGLLRPVARTVANIALPAAGIALLLIAVQRISVIPYALHVVYGGQDFGYIRDESVYDAATAQVKQKMKGVETEIPVSFSARFTLEPLPEGEALLDEYTLSDRIITASGGDIDEAYGLYIDGDFINAVREANALPSLLASLQDDHLTGDPTETVRFIRPVAVRAGIYPSSRVTSVEEVGSAISREVRGEFTYEAQAGDSASVIAGRFEVPQSQIVANNPGILESLLVGQKILISRAEPYLAVQIQRIIAYEEKEPFQTETQEDEDLLKGERKVVREGEPGLANVRAAVTYINDMESERRIIAREVSEPPISRVVHIGTKVFGRDNGSARSSFIVPVPGAKYISNYFNGYSGYRYNHGALDYSANYGIPIIASASGTVTYSSYTAGGYGHHIIITHGSGYQSLYAHMSRRVAQYGDYVEQGQVIGYVGSTGRSTGNHCHFEILVNGAKVDPAKYLY